MEIPIKNVFISKQIKKDKIFCENYYKSNSLSPKNESFLIIKNLKHNFNFGTFFPKTKIKKNNYLKNRKNYSDLCLLKYKKSIINNLINNNKNSVNNLSFPQIILNKYNKCNLIPLKGKTKINYNHITVSNGKSNNNYMAKKKDEGTNVNSSSFLLTKNWDKKDISFIDISSSFHVKLFPFMEKINTIKHLNKHHIKIENYSHKKLLVKLNSLNASFINNRVRKNLNYQKLKNYKNEYENKYINKKIMINESKLENIT